MSIQVMLTIGLEYAYYVQIKQIIVRTGTIFVHIMAVNDTIFMTKDFCS